MQTWKTGSLSAILNLLSPAHHPELANPHRCLPKGPGNSAATGFLPCKRSCPLRSIPHSKCNRRGWLSSPTWTALGQPSVWHHHIHALHQPFPKPNLQVHTPIHTNVFTLTHTWVKTSCEALALGCSLLPPLSLAQ